MVRRNKNDVRPWLSKLSIFNTNAFQKFEAKFSSVRKQF